MKRRAITLLTGLLLPGLLPPAVRAQQSTQQAALAFLEGLYAPYRAKGFNGQPYSQADRFFEPVLAAAIQRDLELAQKNGVPPTLDGDPFVDAQEWEIANLSIRAVASGDQATGLVSFTNLKQKKTLTIELVRTWAGWRIADIARPGSSLRALYKLR